MAAKKMKAARTGIPKFAPKMAEESDVFRLSSHARAREAMEFGIESKGPGFNIFVLGPDRGGRMTSTVWHDVCRGSDTSSAT